MARIRTIKPDAPQHRKVGKLTDRAFRLWVVMLTQADDEGRLVADPDQLRLLAFGYQPKTLTEHVVSALGELTEASLIRLYVSEGTQYADFPSWSDHQRINRPTPSKLPAYESSLSTHGGLTPDRKGREWKGEEGKGVEGSVRGTTPQSPQGGLNGFQVFWDRYPKKEGTGKAEEAWRTHTKGVPLEEIMAGVARWEQSQKWAEDYIPMPATWLNQKRWRDTPQPVRPVSSAGQQTMDAAKRLIQRKEDTTDAK